MENLLLMERAELRLGPGLNVLTGETGAGKTLLAHALDLLLGGRARSGIVRAGAAEAYVEGVFSLPPGLEAAESGSRAAPRSSCSRGACGPTGGPARTCAGARRRSPTCVSSASRLLAFYGQHEHRKLMLSTAQLDVLDAYCGREQLELRVRVCEPLRARARAWKRRARSCASSPGARERELDLLAVRARRDRGGRRRARRRTARCAPSATGCGTSRRCARSASAPPTRCSRTAKAARRELLAEAALDVQEAAAIDPGLAARSRSGSRRSATRPRMSAASCARYLLSLRRGARDGSRRSRSGWPLFARLERKHGGSIAEVLAHAERCRARLDELEDAEVALEDAERPARRGAPGARAPRGGARRRAGDGPRPSWRRRFASGLPSWRCPTRGSRSVMLGASGGLRARAAPRRSSS